MSVFKHFKEISVHLSLCMGIRVENEEGNALGKVNDLFVDYEEIYPLVIAIQYTRNKRHFYIRWEDIVTFSYKKIVVKTAADEGRSRTFPKISDKRIITSILANQFTEAIEYPPLGKVILDKQIVDTSGKKVVRVNDIQLLKVGQFLRITHAEVGLRSMLRRLGFENSVDKVVKVFKPNSPFLSKSSLINWKYVHAIPNRNLHSNVKLNLTNDDIKSMHPADIADILEELDYYGRDAIFSNLDPRLKAETLSEVEQDMQASFIRNEKPEEAAKIIEEMNTDDAADILHELDKEKAEKIIESMNDDEIIEEIQELMEYEDDTAGGLMSSEFFDAKVSDTKKFILEKLNEIHTEIDYLYDIYVLDEKERLLGTLTLTDILTQSDSITVGDIMNDKDIKVLAPKDDWKEVASFMSKYNLHSAPVVDEKNELLGIVSVDDVLPWLLKERS